MVFPGSTRTVAASGLVVEIREMGKDSTTSITTEFTFR
jgi:hypothetical protein